jgi:hypothetical protein
MYLLHSERPYNGPDAALRPLAEVGAEIFGMDLDTRPGQRE